MDMDKPSLARFKMVFDKSPEILKHSPPLRDIRKEPSST
jgi:hypothetical protein